MPPDIAVETLVDKAIEAGGPDNITVVIVEITSGSDGGSRSDIS
jgi:serine/threonine protein phosphatase PrpC